MPANWTVEIDVKVSDQRALWRKARDYLADIYGATEEAAANSLIGTEDDPDVGACLQMLLDRSEFLDGAEIQESRSEHVSGLLEQDDDDDASRDARDERRAEDRGKETGVAP